MKENLREQYEKAQELGKPAFLERPYFGSPGAPAQAETNASQIWGHINAGYLIAYEYTRWWKESAALRNSAVLGDWSWLNKTRITGRDAGAFMNYATVKELAKQAVGQIMYTPMLSAEGKVAIEGLTLRLARGRIPLHPVRRLEMARIPAREDRHEGRAAGRHAGLHVLSPCRGRAPPRCWRR